MHIPAALLPMMHWTWPAKASRLQEDASLTRCTGSLLLPFVDYQLRLMWKLQQQLLTLVFKLCDTLDLQCSELSQTSISVNSVKN